MGGVGGHRSRPQRSWAPGGRAPPSASPRKAAGRRRRWSQPRANGSSSNNRRGSRDERCRRAPAACASRSRERVDSRIRLEAPERSRAIVNRGRLPDPPARAGARAARTNSRYSRTPQARRRRKTGSDIGRMEACLEWKNGRHRCPADLDRARGRSPATPRECAAAGRTAGAICGRGARRSPPFRDNRGSIAVQCPSCGPKAPHQLVACVRAASLRVLDSGTRGQPATETDGGAGHPNRKRRASLTSTGEIAHPRTKRTKPRAVSSERASLRIRPGRSVPRILRA